MLEDILDGFIDEINIPLLGFIVTSKQKLVARKFVFDIEKIPKKEDQPYPKID